MSQIPNGEYQIPDNIYTLENQQGFVEQTPVDEIAPRSETRVSDEKLLFQQAMISASPEKTVKDELTPICDEINRARENEIDNRLKGFNKPGMIRLFSQPVSANDVKKQLIVSESQIGSELFVVNNLKQRIEFFYEGRDEKNIDSWFYHESTTDGLNKETSKTLHFEILPAGVLLVGYGYLSGSENDKFVKAAKEYHTQVMQKIYHRSANLDGFDYKQTA